MQIIVNATALASSGGLSILKQFIDEIPEDGFEYILFINDEISLTENYNNIKLIPKDVKSLWKRVYWDIFGAKKWLKEEKIYPSATISLQNTNFRTYKKIPNFIYFHNSIPFCDNKWNPFKTSERTLWFYKNIYPFFIKLFIFKNTEIFVQTKVIKSEFSKYFNIPQSRIHVISPVIELPNLSNTVNVDLDSSRYNIFYPATPFIHKNHSTIIDALSLLDKEIQKKIMLHLTCTKQEMKHLINNKNTDYTINYLGQIPFNKVLGMYKNADMMLFPSFIETLGLPLLEAAFFGLPIIAADLPYSHEILSNYEGVTYVDYNDPKLWSEEISKKLLDKGKRFQSINIEQSDSWNELFQIVKNKIQNKE
ncbi:MAG TPA: glycosyltransferase [Draconibacterium sp.]|nr:glycosyltransferase [Draconibacterium sp.]